MDAGSRHLVLIPWPVMGHVQIIEFANHLLRHHNHLFPETPLSATVLLMKLPDYIDAVTGSYTDLLSTVSGSTPRLNFVHLPPTDPAPEWSSRTRGFFTHSLVLSQRSNVGDFLRTHRSNIAAVVTDMLCTSMIDVAAEFDLPAYVFFTSPASFLGAMLHCQTLHDEKNRDVPGLRDSVEDVEIPSFRKPVPPSLLSLVLVDRWQWFERFLHYSRDYRKAKGIILNTFVELETYALDSFAIPSAYGAESVPPVYPIGPIINRGPSLDSNKGNSEVLQWLDNQPSGSVVFLCFGSQGSLEEDQIRELAIGLKKSEARFLWSLRRQSPENERARFPSEYESFKHVLPEGFLDSTAKTGKVVGWVPQLNVLSHPAVGGFVSHCGWNSVLESLWCGVPLATWPLHAEQQMNAFQLARELGLAVEIVLDYHERGVGRGLMSDRIEKGIRELMESGSEVRKRAKEMKEKSRMSVVEGGSSFVSFQKLIQDITHT